MRRDRLVKESFNKNFFIVSHNKVFSKISDNILDYKNFTLYKKNNLII